MAESHHSHARQKSPEERLLDTRFDAYISYRGCDEADAKLGAALQKQLEHYVLPLEFRKQVFGTVFRRRPFPRIFFDANCMQNKNDLEQFFQDILNHTQSLIVLYSDQVGTSEWIPKEIYAFRKAHQTPADPEGTARIVVLQTSGALPVQLDALTLPLAQLDAAADTPEETILPEKPLPEVRPGNFQEPEKALHGVEFCELVSGLLPESCGLSAHDLMQHALRWTLLKVSAVFLALLMLVTGFLIFANRKNEEVTAQLRQTQISESKYLARSSQELLERGDKLRAVELALEALPKSETAQDRPLVTEAYYALAEALGCYRSTAQGGYVLTDSFSSSEISGIKSACLTPDKTKLLFINQLGKLYGVDLDTKALLGPYLPPDLYSDSPTALFCDLTPLSDGRILFFTSRNILCWDCAGNTLQWASSYTNSAIGIMGIKDHTFNLWFDARENEDILLVSGGALLGTAAFCLSNGSSPLSLGGTGPVCLSPDGAYGIVQDYAMVNFFEFDWRLYEWPSYKSPDSYTIQSSCWLTDRAIAALSKRSDGQSASFLLECYDHETDQLPWSTELPGYFSDNGSETSLQLAHIPQKDGTEKAVLVCTIGPQLFLLDPETGTLEQKFALSGPATKLFFAQDGITVVENNGTVEKIMFSGEMKTLLEQNHSIFCAVQDPDTGTLFLGCSDESRILVLQPSEKAEALTALHDNPTGEPFYSPLGYRVTIHERDKDHIALKIWSTLEATPLAVTDWGGEKQIQGITQLDGKTILWYLNVDDETLTGWWIEGDQKLYSYPLCPQSRRNLSEYKFMYRSEPFESWFTENGTYVYVEENLRIIPRPRNRIHVLDLTTGKSKSYLVGEENFISRCIPLRHGATLAVLQRKSTTDVIYSRRGDCTLTYLDLTTGIWLKPEEPVTVKVQTSDFPSQAPLGERPDGTLLAAWTGSNCILLNAESLELVQTLPLLCSTGCEFLFLDNDHLLVWGDDHRLTLWSIPEQKILYQDTEIISTLVSLTRDPASDQFAVRTQEGVYLYRCNADKTSFARALSAPGATLSADYRELFFLDTETRRGGFSPLYTLDELLQKADAYLNGRTLSEAERARYFLE